MNELQTIYSLVKQIIKTKEELVTWARLSRENNLTSQQEVNMMKHAFEIDELLREIGIDWIEDYEANNKIREKMK